MSFKFVVMNEVKQEWVLSPMLFAVYTDSLLKRLEDTLRGRFHMESCFTVANAYADNITHVLTQCKSAFETMMELCENYTCEFDILVLFNGINSNLLYFKGRSSNIMQSSYNI